MDYRSVALALLSALLFGASTPAAKTLLGATDPVVLAGLLYCGAGAGVATLRRLTPALRGPGVEAPLKQADLPWLAGAIAAGGIAGPVLMMLGLARTSASTASLLLTLEGVATGMGCIAAGAVVLAWTGRPTFADLLGPTLIVSACAAWGIDNNLTRKVSLADPLQIVELRGLVAGPVNLGLGLWTGGAVPEAGAVAVAGVVGFVGYGISLALFLVALRHLGAARTSAYFSTAPFLGAVAATLFLAEPLTPQTMIAGALMGLGVWLHLTERHE